MCLYSFAILTYDKSEVCAKASPRITPSLRSSEAFSHIAGHNPSEYLRVVAEFRMDPCNPDRLHHPAEPLSLCEIVVCCAALLSHALPFHPPLPSCSSFRELTQVCRLKLNTATLFSPLDTTVTSCLSNSKAAFKFHWC